MTEFETDVQAWTVLGNRFCEFAGLIKPRHPGYRPTDDELRAIRYLILEWDYGYED